MQAPVEHRRLAEVGDRFHGLAFRGAVVAPRPDRTAPVRRKSATQPKTNDTEEEDPGSPEEKAFLEFALVRGRQALQNYRLAPLVRRLPACLRALRVDSLDDARRLLERNPELTAMVLDSLLIGATSFYRDAPVFDYVRDVVLPCTFASPGRVRILSAACSDGAELYTVAALVDRIGRLSEADLWGIDCRESAVSSARQGLYAENALLQLPEALRESYLEPVGSQRRIRESLRTATNWTVANALSASRMGTWNVIFCRNLAIYLRPATSSTLWRNLAWSLQPGGHLIVGRAEKPCVAGLTHVGPCTYRKEL